MISQALDRRYFDILKLKWVHYSTIKLTLPISKFCLMSMYREAAACDRVQLRLELQCLSKCRHKSAQASVLSSNNNSGYWNTCIYRRLQISLVQYTKLDNSPLANVFWSSQLYPLIYIHPWVWRILQSAQLPIHQKRETSHGHELSLATSILGVM